MDDAHADAKDTSESGSGLESYGPDGDGADDGQDYVDRSKIDFDPADGLYSGTAVDGTSDIPGAEGDDADQPDSDDADD